MVENPPLLLLGSGCSAPYGLPGMQKLGEHLISSLSDKYAGDFAWNRIQEKLENGVDLESALSDEPLSQELLRDIKVATWELITSKDLALMEQLVFERKRLPLSQLLHKFFQVHPQCINVITTNYDRVVEYACDSDQLPINTGFDGFYLKHYRTASSESLFPSKRSVNLIKVHGSLDVFVDEHGAVVSISLLQELKAGLIPEIVTPGESKYKAVLQGTPRRMLSFSDDFITKARGFLCIGYGFNDPQIQERIIERIRMDIPIIVLTKEISDSTAHLLANNATQYVSIQCGQKPNTTEFCINKQTIDLNGTFWDIAGFMTIIG